MIKILINITSQSSATGHFTSARDEFCIEAKDGTQYKIYCLNNSGGIIASENINNTLGDIWSKGCMKSGKGLDFNYEGDVLVACDQGGFGYLFNFSAYNEKQVIDFANDNITYVYGAEGLLGFVNVCRTIVC